MSKIEVNTVAPQCGTTLTLGESGDTVQLGSGASQSGFGRTGTVDWDTTPKTANFNAVSGDGFFCNTTSGAFTATLPSGAAGAIVSLADYAGTWQTNNLTVSPQSGEKIGGVSADVVLNTEGQSVTFVYVDSTQGWVNVQDSTSNVRAENFITATGGTITTSGNCKIHTFTGPGTFCVSAISTTAEHNTVSYLVVGGGGGAGARWHSGGGGAGGFREVKSPTTPYTASPLDGYPSAPNRVTLTVAAFPITVGAGGTGGPDGSNNNGTDGNTSTFSTITAALGGRGGTYGTTGSPGGSGGGGGSSTGPAAGGTGNTPPTTPAQGQDGGAGDTPAPGGDGGGGGGAGGAGSPHNSSSSTGGAGVTTCITASPVGYAGGSAGARVGNPGGAIPSPAWGSKATNPSGAGENARANSGSGGGTTNQNPSPNAGGAGGSGIVVIRYKYQ